VSRSDYRQFALAGLAVVAAALAHYLGVTPVVTFLVAAGAIALLARLVGGATEQLGGRVGSSAAGVVQSALGNLPELFISIFALEKGLVGVVQAALVGSIIANGVLVLGIAFLVGGLRNGTQKFDSSHGRTIATLAAVSAAILSVPTLAHTFHTPATPRANRRAGPCRSRWPCSAAQVSLQHSSATGSSPRSRPRRTRCT
jgi:Ca2+:H+ antiporter